MTAGNVMNWSEWFSLDGLALAELIRRGELSAQEAVFQARAGVGAVDDTLQGALELFDDTAENPDTDGPDPSGPLYGVPMFIKDLGSRLSGRKQEYGSRLLRDSVAQATDPLVENYLRAGLIPFGRSTTPEFGMTFDTSTEYLGRLKVTRNPWNPERTAGGSSGGSASLVAAGVTPISMSSDGGGSTRVPASFCGLVGLKASRGRIAMPLNHSEYTWRIAVEGVVTRSVRDSAAVLDFLHAKPIGGTFYPMATPKGSYLEELSRPPERLRIALSTGSWGRDGSCDPEIVERVRDVARLLEDMGHEVNEIDDGGLCDWEVLWRSYLDQWVCARLMYVPLAVLHGLGEADVEALLTPIAYRHFEAARSYETLDLLKAIAGNNIVTRAFAGQFARHDLLLCPTSAVRVPVANGPYSLLHDEPLWTWLNRFADAGRYTIPGNEAGLPGLSFPAGFDSDNMPMGAMLYAGQGREDLLLRTAAAIEAERPGWFGRVPSVSVVNPGKDGNGPAFG